MMKVLEVYKNMLHECRLPQNLVFISQWKLFDREKLKNVESRFHQNYRIVTSHLILVKGDLENVSQCQNLQTFSFSTASISQKLPTANLSGAKRS